MFELNSILDKDRMLHYPVLEMGVNSKISSLCWNSYVKSCLLAADYEGAIQLWDVSTNAVTAQFEEHTKRVWSADFSKVTKPPHNISRVLIEEGRRYQNMQDKLRVSANRTTGVLQQTARATIVSSKLTSMW